MALWTTGSSESSLGAKQTGGRRVWQPHSCRVQQLHATLKHTATTTTCHHTGTMCVSVQSPRRAQLWPSLSG